MILYSSDVSNSNSAIQPLEEYVIQITQLIASIDSFIIATRPHLKGDVFDKCISKLSGISDELNKQKQEAVELSKSIQTAFSQMSTYSGGEPKLDTAELEQKRIERANAEKNMYTEVLVTDKNGNAQTDSNGNKRYTQVLNEEAKQNYERLDSLVKKIENLESTDSSAYNSIL